MTSHRFKLPERFNLAAAFRDLSVFLRSRQRHDYLALVLAVGITGFIVYAFNHDSHVEAPPQIVYVNNWPASRTDAEIKAEQKTDAAARQKAMAERRAEFQRLDNSMKAWGL